jgi:superfamily I DNA and/or RNA helicase
MAAAFTNIAVDNLLEGLIKEGIPALRIGQSDRIAENLQNCTLEARCAESPIQKRMDEKKLQIEKIQENGTQSGFKQISALRKEIADLKETMINTVLKSHDVICTTCVSAGHDLLEPICFQFVIIDECSQSIEPGTLIAIMKGSHQVVLVGDHNQLPPTVLSKEASEQGLSKSLFERMIDSGISPFILNIQYRMHPGISSFPAKQFYQNKIFDGITESDRPHLKYVNWVSKDIPVIFYDIKSEESISKSLSRYNMDQAMIVTDIVNSVISKGMNPSEIGVISPYAAQVSILKKNCPKVDVKSVDGFQGREKDLIVLSTVRSGDSKDPIGFLQDWRRMNVAITRAKYGLFVIGDKNTLCKDKNWRDYIEWLESKKLITIFKK